VRIENKSTVLNQESPVLLLLEERLGFISSSSTDEESTLEF
jgi:hypothetical protein